MKTLSAWWITAVLFLVGAVAIADQSDRFNPIGPDLDGDGIPNQTDVYLGAVQAALNGADYNASYIVIPYPNGDVPRNIGSCSDVVVRALRNAGLDLQKEIHEDAVRRPHAYPEIKKPDTNIDHRRTRNIAVYMKKYFLSVKSRPGSHPREIWLPGDIVCFDTLSRPGPDHIGIVSATKGPSGFPMVINNWATGSKTAEMDLLSWCPVTHHFRMP